MMLLDNNKIWKYLVFYSLKTATIPSIFQNTEARVILLLLLLLLLLL
jgi:hypothetical protein